MLLSGVLVNEGPWSKVSTAEKKRIKEDIPMLNLCGFQVAGPYFRKINDEVTVIFSDRKMERKCRHVDFGILYPMDFIFEGSDNLVPPSFTLVPDVDCLKYLETFGLSDLHIHAVFQEKYFYKAEAYEDRHLVFSPLFQIREEKS